jgi:hypothetical protein
MDNCRLQNDDRQHFCEARDILVGNNGHHFVDTALPYLH